jgi:hypothetical protein
MLSKRALNDTILFPTSAEAFFDLDAESALRGLCVMNETPMNFIATLALLSWPLISFWLYKTQPLNRATLWTILGGQFLLPVGSLGKLAPGIPPIDKMFVPNLAALLGCAFIARRPVRFFSRIGLAEVFLFMLISAPFITSLLNGDAIVTGPVIRPGLTYYDAMSLLESQFVLLLPFFIGRQLLRKATDTEEILRILVIAEVFYSLPTLLEIRLSPQLHTWVYGYPAADFIQQMRAGGFRPMVFIGHGLSTAFYLMTAVLAATALWQVRTQVTPFRPAAVAGYLGVVLSLCHSLGALTYAVVAAPLIRLTKPRLQMRVAVILACIALAYPMARMSDLVPTRTLLDWSASYDAAREDSLAFRFTQEGQMLERASPRFFFGWGGYSRSRIFDPETGRDLSVIDGAWIGTLGSLGLYGFIALFGLLTLPVFRAAAALRYVESARDGVLLAALTLILAINAIDLIPNSGLYPWTWLISGSLLGRAEAMRAAIRTASKSAPLIRQTMKPQQEHLG